MDWDAMKRDIHLATHFLDNIIDVNKYPLPEIDDAVQAHPPHRPGRDGLRRRARAPRHRLRLRPKAWSSAASVMEFFDVEGKRRASGSPIERGPFPEWARTIWGPDETCARDENGRRIRPMQLLRNCNVTTVAPTGTISIIAGCSSGLEPLFAVAFMRNQAGVMMPDVNEDFVAHRAAAKAGTPMRSSSASRRRARVTSPRCPSKWQRVFVTANQIAPEWHIKNAGRLPGALRLGDLEDDQLRRTRRRWTTCARSTRWRTT